MIFESQFLGHTNKMLFLVRWLHKKVVRGAAYYYADKAKINFNKLRMLSSITMTYSRQNAIIIV